MPPALALTNARVVDGTGAPWFRGSVLVDDGRISDVVRGRVDTGATETVDVDGMVLCPGFVDVHSHSDLYLFQDSTLAPKTRQGITTEIAGQDGLSMAPMYRDGGDSEWEDHLSGLNGRAGREWSWGSTADYLDSVEECGVASNVAMLVGHGTVRYNVMGMAARDPDDAELAEMADLVGEALSEGAIGLSTGLVYAPQVNAATGEVRRLAAELAPYGRPFVAHIRNESDGIWDALDEFVDVGADEGVPLHLSHFKLKGPAQHGKAGRAIALLEAARERGVDITADQYPYRAGSTMLGSHLPAWVHADGPAAAVEHLADEASRARIREHLSDQQWGRIVVTHVAGEENAWVEGLSVEEIAAERGVDPETAAMDLLLDEELEVSRVYHMLAEADVREILGCDYVCVGTDGLLTGKPHPRTYGTYPRILGHYVREENLLSLEAAVGRMTSLPARAMGLHRKGLVRPGMDADLVVFDPERVGTGATYEEPRQFPDGLPHVLVGGTFVVRDGEVTGETPGTVIRK
jgi:N-acyl-D-amino-acid deacylase